jgi:hypothetical protein
MYFLSRSLPWGGLTAGQWKWGTCLRGHRVEGHAEGSQTLSHCPISNYAQLSEIFSSLLDCFLTQNIYTIPKSKLYQGECTGSCFHLYHNSLSCCFLPTTHFSLIYTKYIQNQFSPFPSLYYNTIL